jgi:hypothetical protein
MAMQKGSKLNLLKRRLPEGLLVDAAWLTQHGYSTALRSQYLSAGWLEQPARRVYCQPRGVVRWEQVVVSLQLLLDRQLVVGGRSALEFAGFAHYVGRSAREVHLYGPSPPPSWVNDLKLEARFCFHNSRRLFETDEVEAWFGSLAGVLDAKTDVKAMQSDHFRALPWGQWSWPLTCSTPERALLELLDELPDRETFHQVDMLTEGMSSLSPRRLQRLLKACTSIKVKRLFFFFADRHQHAWLKHIDKDGIDLGSGNRVLVRGGRLDRTYRITVPGDMDGVQ